MPNIVYVLTNEAMPGLVKIGYTSNSVGTRIKELNTATGVPLPFECFYAAEVPDAPKIETILHQLFSEHRVNPRREFFRIQPAKAVLALSIGSFKEIDEAKPLLEVDETIALEKARSRRPRINLDALGVKVGSTLVFCYDSNVTATVEPGNKINFEGRVTSLSAAAEDVLIKRGRKPGAYSGSEYWMFEDELLDDRRTRLEREQYETAATAE